ncbi:MAG: peptidase MA family metallohydrolase [Chloroflexaceae bacterium]|jgi:hypothetical protein|nr:peptidase MA family metallohydrolase [Chloroflexaceae bacterium]
MHYSHPQVRFRRRWPLLLVGLLLVLLGPLFVAPAAHAQQVDWRERETNYFTILYDARDSGEADNYVAFVDGIYDEVATIFSHRTTTPITLRLFPTNESYFQANPMARGMGGIVAHADFRRREVVVIVEQTRKQPPDEIPNNIRHELTHIVASDLTDNRLNTGFQEGIAQYVERSSQDILTQKAAYVAQARDQNRLLTWSDFDDRNKVYGDPEVGYPQSLSVVAFLVERYGFNKFREFLTVSARSSGYRSALERAYGVSPTELELAWREWLPSYLNGGFRRNALTSYDLSYPKGLMEQGRYAEAETELNQAVAWLERNTDTQPQELLQEAQALQQLSRDGQRAEKMTEQARKELERTNYEGAQQLIAQARDVYRQLGDTRQESVLQAYAERATRGLGATRQLLEANDLAASLRYPQARAAADAAAREFAALGDQIRLDNALALRRDMDTRQRLFGGAILAVGVSALLISLLLLLRRRPAPADAW